MVKPRKADRRLLASTLFSFLETAFFFSIWRFEVEESDITLQTTKKKKKSYKKALIVFTQFFVWRDLREVFQQNFFFFVRVFFSFSTREGVIEKASGRDS